MSDQIPSFIDALLRRRRDGGYVKDRLEALELDLEDLFSTPVASGSRRDAVSSPGYRLGVGTVLDYGLSDIFESSGSRADQHLSEEVRLALEFYEPRLAVRTVTVLSGADARDMKPNQRRIMVTAAWKDDGTSIVFDIDYVPGGRHDVTPRR